jgi:hypothetical protein
MQALMVHIASKGGMSGWSTTGGMSRQSVKDDISCREQRAMMSLRAMSMVMVVAFMATARLLGAMPSVVGRRGGEEEVCFSLSTYQQLHFAAPVHDLSCPFSRQSTQS